MGYRLTIERPVRPGVSDEIAAIDAVIATKPAAVVIAESPNVATPAASLQSMRSAGIKVVFDFASEGRSGAAHAGADAVRRAVGELAQ